MSIRLKFGRETVWMTATLSAAASVAVAVVILGGAVGVAASGWGPAGAFGGGGAPAGQRVPTPEIVDWEYLDHGEFGATWLLVAEDAGGPDWWPGLAVTCSGGVLAMWAFFGPHPADGSPVQLAVRTPDGRVERHGPVTAGGPDTGFHDPAVEARTDVLRMLAAAAVTDSLVSNGHYSFWNRASPLDNRQVRLFAQACR